MEVSEGIQSASADVTLSMNATGSLQQANIVHYFKLKQCCRWTDSALSCSFMQPFNNTKSESFDLFCRCVRKQTDGSKNSKLHLNVISNLVFSHFSISQWTHSFLSLGNKAAVLAVHTAHKHFVCLYLLSCLKGTFKMICQLKHRYFLFCSAGYMLKCIAAHGIYTKNGFLDRCGPL